MQVLASVTVHQEMLKASMANAQSVLDALATQAEWSPESSKATRELMKSHAAASLISAQTLVGNVRIINRQVNGDISA